MNESDLLKDILSANLEQEKRKWRWQVFFRLLFWGYLFFVTVILVVFNSGSADSDSYTTSEKHVAMIKIEGVISSSDPNINSDNIVNSLEKAFKNDKTKGIILSINSPGGSAVESDIIYRAILDLKKQYTQKPIYAVVKDYAASGGYYIAVACDEIYANRSSLLGSIGVRYDSFGFSDIMKRYGVERRLYTAGTEKDLLDPFSPQKKESVKYLQSILDGIHKTFIEAVQQGRGTKLSSDVDYFSGRIWVGTVAKDIGIIDGFASVKQITKKIDDDERIFDYSPRRDFWQKLRDTYPVYYGY